MKALIEKRNDLVEEMEGLTTKAKEETRSLNDEEITRFEAIKSEIRNIDKTIKLEEESRGLEKMEIKNPEVRSAEEIRAEEVAKEERAFVELIVEGRAANLPAATNGSVIPVSIANKIVETVKEISPLLSKTTIWRVKGSLNIPAYDWTQHTTAYQGSEFTAVSSSAGVFSNITLSGFVAGSLALISKSMVNRADVNIVPFVVDQIAKSIANFLENELINGTVASGKMQGLKTVAAGQTNTTATTLVITPEEIVKLKRKLPQIYQQNASFLMHPDTYTYLQTLKDTQGRFLFGNTLGQDGGDVLLSKPVMLSENMDQIGAGKFQIFYGDFSGLHVKVEQDVEVQVLLEKYADQHAIGTVAWLSYDSKIAEPRKIVCLKGL